MDLGRQPITVIEVGKSDSGWRDQTMIQVRPLVFAGIKMPNEQKTYMFGLNDRVADFGEERNTSKNSYRFVSNGIKVSN